MRKIFLFITSLFLLTFLGGTVLAQKAILQTDCGKFECEEKSAHFEDKYGPGNWTDAGAECICQYYTPEEWKLTYCARGTGPPTEEELQHWRDCGVPVPGGPLSGSWGWTGEKEEKEYEIHEPADLIQVTFLNYCSDPDWSPDGSQIIFERQKEGDRGIYLINADGTGLTKIGPGYNPSWSPVDNRIIYRGDDPWRSLFLVDLDKGWESKIKLVNQINEHGGWSPDGKKIAYSSPNGSKSSSIWVMNSDGSGKTRLTTNEDGYCAGTSFSYDGSKIVYLKGFASYAVGGGEDEPNEIWVMDSDGSNKHMIYAPGDSTQLIFQRAWNKNNKILFMRTWYRVKPPQVWMINADGSDPKPVVAGSDVFGDPVWDNTGTKVAISRSSVQLAVPGDIWIFSYEEPSEEEEVIEEPEEEVEKVPKNIFQKIWETIINFFKWIFRIK